MIIAGLQKLTAIDYPNKLACTIFLHSCNFRCGFCHNPELVIENNIKAIPEQEIFDFLEKRAKYLDGVCITGGEPLLTLDLEFLKKIKEKGYLIKLDTNGYFPSELQKLIDLKLVDFIAMDIKSGGEKYSEITGVDINLNIIEESIKIISEFPDHEFRTTIIEGIHTKEEMKDIAEWLTGLAGRKLGRFCLQGFKNQGKLLDPAFESYKDTSEEYLNGLAEEIRLYFDEVVVRV